MSRITATTDVDQVKPEELAKFVDLFLQNVAEVVNGNLDFSTNFNCQLISITFSTADTDVSSAHNLKRTPSGYIVTSASAATSVYNGSAPNNATTLVLRASAPATVGFIVF